MVLASIFPPPGQLQMALGSPFMFLFPALNCPCVHGSPTSTFKNGKKKKKKKVVISMRTQTENVLLLSMPLSLISV